MKIISYYTDQKAVFIKNKGPLREHKDLTDASITRLIRYIVGRGHKTIPTYNGWISYVS